MTGDDDDFGRDLDAVFEDRAAEFSPELRGLLRQLWDEGVKQGERRERTRLHVVAIGEGLRAGELRFDPLTRIVSRVDRPEMSMSARREMFGEWEP